MLDILYKSKGRALAISEEEMLDSTKEMAQKEGVLLAPEGAAVWMAFKKLLQEEWIKPAEKVVLLNTGTIYKYMDNY